MDVPKLNANLLKVARFFSSRKIDLRPHIKTHKSPQIAKMQIEAGAIGITVATLAEAEAMIESGIDNIFIAYPTVGQANLKKLAKILSYSKKIILAVDSIFHLEQLARIPFAEFPLQLRIEINSGQNRCGLRPEKGEMEPIMEFLKIHGHLFSIEGVFTHAGHAYRCASPEQIEEVASSEQAAVLKAAQILRSDGFACKTTSTGSTPTAFFTGSAEINECRPGNYVFFDAMQVANKTAMIDECAFTVISTVIATYSDRLIIDAGSKALGLDKGAHGQSLLNSFGLIKGHPHLSIAALSEEHGIINFKSGEKVPAPGEIVEIIPNHSCAAANLFSHYHVFRENRLVETWPLVGRR
ncbi:MAG: alanine racemase [Candidatus Rifleibacteriota bacterium]